MGKYIVKRILMGFATIFVLLSITFFLTRLMPGNPFVSENVTENVLQSLQKEYGLDQPICQQYVTYLKHLSQGSLGVSYKKPGVSVNEVIRRAVLPTFMLGGIAFLAAFMGGIGIGILQAVTKKRTLSGVLIAGECIGMGIPNFVLALLLLLLFGVKFRIFPSVGLATPMHYVLPVISLAIYPMVTIARFVCRNVKTELQQEYVVFAGMKGLSKRQVLWKHVLKNALPSVLTYVGPMLAFLLTGSFAVESIYTIPGLGREFVNAIANRDYTMIMGLTIFMGVLVIVVQLVMDLLCAILDPRIRISLQE